MYRITLAALVTSAALAGGCAGEAYYGGGTLTATTVAPDLLYVSPGVSVVADYDYPVFYADNYYWRYDNGAWYRSSWYTGGWIYATPPRAVRSIQHPYAYRHYRPSGYISRREYRAPAYRAPVYRDNRPVYRQPPSRVYRAPAPTYRGEWRAPAPTTRAPAPVVREHRAAPARPAPAPTVREHRERRDEVRRRR